MFYYIEQFAVGNRLVYDRFETKALVESQIVKKKAEISQELNLT